MSEKNNSSAVRCFGIGGAGTNTDKSTCINVDKIYDSARDKDCIEDLRVFVDQNGNPPSTMRPISAANAQTLSGRTYP